MDLTKLNPAVLRELLKLSEQKSALQKQVAAIDARISSLGTGKAAATPGKRRGRPAGSSTKPKKAKAPKAAKAPKPPKAAKAPKAPKPVKTGKRGALKGGILKLLAAAGAEGASVKDIAAKLGAKSQNVHVWFSTTGKKLAEVVKLSAGRYAYKPATGASLQPEA
ncbi:MAG: hypothetical protein PHC88_07010 [Terrimicrobiaceae bacterium]|nr:hypothetical protein [Terrimicrobiaceae bacterium]